MWINRSGAFRARIQQLRDGTCFEVYVVRRDQPSQARFYGE